MKSNVFLIFTFILSNLFAQKNISFESKIDYHALHQTKLNDVWGHIDTQGNEYALVGTRNGVSIVSLQNQQAEEIYWIEGDYSIWRDINTFQNFAYVTTEAESGLLIIDLSSLPDVNGISYQYYTGPIDNPWQSAHTLYTDSIGRAYIFGANRGNGGVIILDIITNPNDPIEIGTFDDWYCHDGYVIDDTMYLAHINEGFMSLVDISNLNQPQVLSTKFTPYSFTHNVWISDDKKTAYTTDEKAGSFIAAYDISDPINPNLTDIVRYSDSLKIIPHNVHFKDSFLIVSYYTKGVVLYDASINSNLIEVGYYDSYPSDSSIFDGCWATFPFLPSGKILLADISQGLFVLNPIYQKAAYLNGNVKDANTNQLLSQVKVEIINTKNNEFTDLNGNFQTGNVDAGNFSVRFFIVGYEEKIITIELFSDSIVNLNVNLIPLPTFNFTIQVKDETTNLSIQEAFVKVKGSLTENQVQTNGLGQATIALYYKENYEITIGKWLYSYHCETRFIDEQNVNLIVYLNQAIEDNFTFDYGWLVQNENVSQGAWSREKPFKNGTNASPQFDEPEDCENYAYLTQNSESPSEEEGDLLGKTSLVSPIFSLKNSTDLYLHTSLWFYCYHGSFPFDDTLYLKISNGTKEVILDRLYANTDFFGTWNKRSYYIPDFIEPTEFMQINVEIEDKSTSNNITEGGFDNLYFSNKDELNQIDETFNISPNPFHDKIYLKGLTSTDEIYLFDSMGKIILKMNDHLNNIEISTQNLKSGLYILKINKRHYKLIKH